MDIYSILSSKPHNEHYLNRYVRFISKCERKNNEFSVKTHRHHICPKAKDMFPEFESFSKSPWNLARLTPRQHFIAHLMLWKAYPNISSQFYALWQMKHKNNEQVNSRLYESILIEYGQKVSDRFKNKVSVYDDNGVHQRIPKSEYDRKKHNAISSNRVVAKTKLGEYITVTVEEFSNNNNLCGITKGIKIWNNGHRTVHAYEKPSDEYVRGPLPLTHKQKKTRNKKTQNTIGKRTPEETKIINARNSLAQKNYWNNLSQEERKKSTDTRKKMSEAALKKNPGFSAICKCPKCGKEGQKANISRHHGIDGKKCKW